MVEPPIGVRLAVCAVYCRAFLSCPLALIALRRAVPLRSSKYLPYS